VPESSRPIGSRNAIVDEEFRLYFRDYYTDKDEEEENGQELSFEVTCQGDGLPGWIYKSSLGYLIGVPSDGFAKTRTTCTVYVSDGCDTVTEDFEIYVNRRPIMHKTFESDF